MKFRTLALVLSIFFSSMLQIMAQENKYAKIDKYVSEMREPRKLKSKKLAKKLSRKCRSDEERARAFFIWLAYNVEYDIENKVKGKIPSQKCEDVLAKKKAVCQGYSEVFKALCEAKKIPCQLVVGFPKQDVMNPNIYAKPTHGWNAVKLDNQWYLVDATWGAGVVKDNKQYIKRLNNRMFKSNPSQFVYRHLPTDPIWQLLPNPISMEDFEKDTFQIKNKLSESQNLSVNYLDTLAQYEKQDSLQKLISSCERTLRFFPNSAFAQLKASYGYKKQSFRFLKMLGSKEAKKDPTLMVEYKEKGRIAFEKAQNYITEALKSPDCDKTQAAKIQKDIDKLDRYFNKKTSKQVVKR